MIPTDFRVRDWGRAASGKELQVDNTETELWIEAGKLVNRPVDDAGQAFTDKHLFAGRGMIKLVTSQRGTIVHWVMFCANWSSQFFLNDLIMTCVAPVTLRYFNAGWFEETLGSTEAAQHRLQVLLAKSDVRLHQRTIATKFDPDHHLIPDLLRDIYESKSVPEVSGVVCRVNLESQVHTVESIGEKSELARIWGVVPVSYPCQTGHSYDKVVSKSYFEAIQTQKPVYDHVLAAMVKPKGEVEWLSYQRVIIPERTVVRNEGRVHVMCAGAPVDIHLL